MTSKQFNRTRLATVMSFEAFLKLDSLIQDHQKTFPYPIETVKYFKNSQGANLLTSIVIKYLKLLGHHAERINTTGTLRKDKTGSYKWTHSGSMKGSADIHAVIRGMFVAIEIKFGRDRQSKKQKEYQGKIENSGAKYIIVKSLDNLLHFLQ